MARLWNATAQAYQEIPEEEVQQAITSGQYGFAENAMVPMVLPGGTKFEVEAQYARKAFDLGARYITAEEARQDRLKKEYGKGWGNALSAFALGTLSGVTLSGSNLALVKAGIISKEQLDAYKQYQSGAYMSGDVAGIVGATVLSGGFGGAALGAGRAAQVARLTPGVATARAASKAGGALAQLAGKRATTLGGKYGAKALGHTAEGAIDAAAYAAADQATEAMLGNPQVTAESFAANVGMSALLGGAIGGALPGMFAASLPAREKAVENIRRGWAFMTGGSTAATVRLEKAAEVLSRREGIDYETAAARLAPTVEEAEKRIKQDVVTANYISDHNKLVELIGQKTRQLESLKLEQEQNLLVEGEQLLIVQEQRAELQRKVDELSDFTDEDRRIRAAQEQSDSVSQRYTDAINELENEVANLKAARDSSDANLKTWREQLKKDGKYTEGRYTRDIETHQVDGAIELEGIYNDVEDIRAATKGIDKTNKLTAMIEPGIEEGTTASDVIQQTFQMLAKARERLLNRDPSKLLNEVDVTQVERALDLLEESFIEKVEAANLVGSVEKPTMSALQRKLRGVDEADLRTRYENYTTNIPAGDARDAALKRELFVSLDNMRKSLGEVVFGPKVDDQIRMNTRALLRDSWNDIRQIQQGKAFGKAGEQIKALNESFASFIGKADNFDSRLVARETVDKRRVIDNPAARRYAGNPDANVNVNQYVEEYLASAVQMATASMRVGLTEPAAVQALVNKVSAYTSRLNDARTLQQELKLLKTMKGDDFRANDEIGHAVNNKELVELALLRDNAEEAYGEALEQYAGKQRTLAETRLDRKFATAAERANILEAQQEKSLLDLFRQPELDISQTQLTAAEESIADINRRTASMKQADAKANLAAKKDISAVKKQIETLRDEARGNVYRPLLPDDPEGMLASLQQTGTSSPAGLAGFAIMGWQGAALSTLGVSSFIKNIRNAAAPERHFYALLEAHDAVVRFQKHRKEVLTRFVDNKLERATTKRTPSTFALLLGSLAAEADFHELFENTETSDFTKAATRLTRVQSDPRMKMKILEDAVAPIQRLMPETAQALQMQLSTSLNYIHQEMPKAPVSGVSSLSRREYVPPDSELYAFQRKIDMIEAPLQSLQNALASRTLTKDEVGALQACHPNFYSSCAEDLITGLTEKKQPPAYDVRNVAATFLGSYVEPTRQAPFVMGMQEMFAQQVEPMGDAIAATRGRSEAAMTPTQERQQRTV